MSMGAGAEERERGLQNQANTLKDYYGQAQNTLQSNYAGAQNYLNQGQQNYQPYMQAGQNALGAYQGMLGLPGGTQYDFQASPMYQWQKNQFQNGLANRMSAAGKSTSSASFNQYYTPGIQAFAAQEAQTRLGQLQTLMGQGYNASAGAAGLYGNQASASMNLGNQMSNNLQNLGSGLGEAQANMGAARGQAADANLSGLMMAGGAAMQFVPGMQGIGMGLMGQGFKSMSGGNQQKEQPEQSTNQVAPLSFGSQQWNQTMGGGQLQNNYIYPQKGLNQGLMY